MKINLAPLERSLRGMIGLAIVASPVMGFDSTPYNWLGLIPWVTAVLGFCPVYGSLGITSCTPNSYRHGIDGVQLPRESGPHHEAHA